MGRYSSKSSQRESTIRESEESDFIWRGIGCTLIIVVPILSYAIGTAIISYMVANHMPVPYELLGRPVLPGFIYQSLGLRAVFAPLTGIQNLYANLVAGLVCLVVISSLISLIYAVAHRVMNPNRYGEFDAPPPKRRKPASKSR